MNRVLTPIVRPLWTDIGPMTHVPLGSSVLQRKLGYKAVLRHHLALRAAARLPINARDLDRLLGMKDVATLYELWTFFKVVEAVEVVLGSPDRVDQPKPEEIQLAIPWSFRASWNGAVSVFYNLSFSRARKAPYQSSSVTLRPDVVIQRGDGPDAELHVLDAKLRVDVESAEDEDDEDERTSKRDDIKKMHTYRDALPNVRTAFVLYPGNVAPDYDSLPSAEGGAVGAIPLVPGEANEHLVGHIRRILGSALPQ